MIFVGYFCRNLNMYCLVRLPVFHILHVTTKNFTSWMDVQFYNQGFSIKKILGNVYWMWSNASRGMDTQHLLLLHPTNPTNISLGNLGC